MWKVDFSGVKVILVCICGNEVGMSGREFIREFINLKNEYTLKMSQGVGIEVLRGKLSNLV